MEEQAKRKLTAILSADVKGYSLLMQDDEEATVRTITAHRDIMTHLIQGCHGRVLDAKGDNILAEFPSVVDAVQCGVEIQKEIESKNSDLPENRKMTWRIGINLGDVIEEGETIYGDGVNIAARLEALAAGGGLCISRTAFDQVKNKLNLGYKYLGEHSVKNIAEPVRVYNVLMEPKHAGTVLGEASKESKSLRWKAVAVMLAIVVVAVAIWHFYLRQPPIEPGSIEKMAYSLRDKPSIAVLPFNNMSGDPEQDYFSDGITEEIITALSKTKRLFVIARNSTFTYKGKPIQVQAAARELGVSFVLEGSVRKAGERVRIAAQLTDASGHSLWAERYDRDLKDIFSVQDEITMRIVTSLQVQLTEGEQARISGNNTDNLEAYLKLLQAREHFYQMNKQGSMRARDLAEEAAELDSEYAAPYVIIALTHMMDLWFRFTDSPEESMRLAAESSEKALSLDKLDPSTYTGLYALYYAQAA